jgi:quercetin dioxygenase-like cupin family protein
MATPTITTEPELPLADRLAGLAPRQGSFEYQNDQPGKTHNWHKHSLNETLFVLAGGMEVFWLQDGSVQRQNCPAGTKIALPAETVHGSTAGLSGCTYIIAPENGVTAMTTFLKSEEHPKE